MSLLVNATYISECVIPLERREPEIAVLLARARTANSINQVNGALLFTGTHFVQTLEGAPNRIDGLLATIVADPRHRRVQIVDRRTVAMPRFNGWSMAYSGSSLFVATIVSQATAAIARGGPRDIGRLMRLLEEIGRDNQIRP
ncbi:BLUF domain-containing protein [Sandarakinorhabdus sp. DWP1-3-1]|uniref:BLUF domain-containing protein n=1 Tax=Sandarakinorhabdus sp. DWP1-3-1 TaxID=2804627 RepID=UPI003CF25657